MLQYSAINGQSLWDICLNTYGTFDQMVKLLEDNDIENIDTLDIPRTFVWDETLSADQNINQEATNARVKYATSSTTTGNVLSVIEAGDSDIPYEGGIDGGDTINTTPDMSYIKTAETEYIAGGGETFVILGDLIGANEIIQITREVQPLKNSEFSFNPVNGQITLNGNAMEADEVLYIIYNETVS